MLKDFTGELAAPPLSPADKNIHGKKFEKFIGDVMRPLEKKYPMQWKRVLDYAAGATGKADGDYELTMATGVFGQPYRFSVECKASVNYDTMARCFRSIIKTGQIASMRLQLRAGACGIFMFEATNNEEVEIWDARPVCAEYYNKRQAFDYRPLWIISKANFPIFAEEWCSDPAAFMKEFQFRSSAQ